jgi:hypothetical protein
VLRRIFGANEGSSDRNFWRKLHNEEFHNLYSNDHVEEDKMGRACSAKQGEDECI